MIEIIGRDGLTKQSLRTAVKDMSLLDHTSLTVKEAPLAHSLLSYIAHSYVYKFDAIPDLKSIPACVALPWKGVSDMMGTLPIMTYSDYLLANVVRIDPTRPDFSLSNLRALLTFPGSSLVNGTNRVFAFTEIAFAHGLQLIVRGDRQIHDNDEDGLTVTLQDLQHVVKKISDIFPLFNSVSVKVFFYDTLRITGAWGFATSVYPDGLIYEGVNEEPLKDFISVSAAKSSIFQTLDAFLGIEYTAGIEEHFAAIRQHMPGDHRSFIDTLRDRPNVASIVMTSKKNELKEEYNGLLKLIHDFRAYHMKMVNKYVMVEAKASKSSKYDGTIESLKTVADVTTAHLV